MCMKGEEEREEDKSFLDQQISSEDELSRG